MSLMWIVGLALVILLSLVLPLWVLLQFALISEATREKLYDPPDQ